MSFSEEMFSALPLGGTIRLPSKKRHSFLSKLNEKKFDIFYNLIFFISVKILPDKIISPDSTKVLRIHVTWVGALSASSTTKI